ncbi:MAG TPA: Vps62-related protein [Solirubrobacteraceae bacterium]|nr:Vps62-related protein [Solirubrobacteraceae bacterium]
MGAHDELLRRFQPALRYDSNEQFFADSAAQYTDAPGIQLRRGPANAKPGTVVASAVPTGDEPKLTLDFLGPQTYANGEKAEKTDVISVRGRDYREQYVALRIARPDLNNRVYGRAAEATGGRLWLQYWLFYFYNDYQLALGFGTHEGDWECVQLRMGPAGDVPDVAVYAQHSHGEKRNWEDVEKLPDDADRPVAYIARGSHAAYFEPGYHETEAWYDIADGKRRAPTLALEIVEDATHAWMRWPGRWGDTTPRDRGAALDTSAPTGPGMKGHWRDANRLLDKAKPSVLRTPPPAPDVKLTRGAGNRLQVAYDFTSRAIAPHALVVTVNSRNEKGVPPITHTFDEVADRPTGTIGTDIELHPERHYDVYASTVAGDPPQPSASRLTEIDPIAGEERPALGRRIARFFGQLIATLRGDRFRR